jgi:hypothetical protein
MQLIRYRLQELTKPRPRLLARRFADLELKMDVDKIRRLGIRIILQPPDWRRRHRYTSLGKTFTVNCIAFAFGMTRSKPFCDIVIGDMRAGSSRPRDLYPELAEPLLDDHHWRCKKARPRAGDLVVYCEGPNKRIKHMGLMLANGMVRSKWGSLPAIFEHRLRHVPMSYGTVIEYYHPIPRAKVESIYRTILRSIQ